MEHFVCTGGCGGVSDHAKACDSETCSMKGEPLVACNCTDGKHEEVKRPSLPKVAK